MHATSRLSRAGILALGFIVAMPMQATVAVGPGAAPPAGDRMPDQSALSAGQLPPTQLLAPTSRVLVRWEHPAATADSSRLDTIRGTGSPRARFVRMTGSGAALYDLGRKIPGRGLEVLSRLRRAAGVVSVEFDQWFATDATIPDDPLAASQWGLLGPADGSIYGADVLPTWDATRGSGVVVAVVDSGLSAAHPDFAGQSVPGYDMVDRDSDAADTGACASSHGTLVAGPIAAVAGNGQGVFGGAPDARIQPVRVSACGAGWSSDGADGLRWAAGGSVPGVPTNPTPAAIINASFGVPDAPYCLAEFASAIAEARARGALVVVAAGNDDVAASTMSPGNCDGVLNVGAVDANGRRSSFSNHEPGLDISAPGNAIWTTARPDSYAQAAGTSLAAPHAAAAAALVKSVHPTFTHDALELVLTASARAPATDTTETGCESRGCGAGIVNASQAFQRLASSPMTGFVLSSRPFPLPGQSFTVRALAVDGAGVTGAEVRVDGGSWQSLAAEDGAFGEPSEWLSGTLTAPTTQGHHAVCARATDATSGAGTEACTTILVDAGPPTTTAPALSAASASAGAAIGFTSTISDVNGLTSAEYSIDGGPWIPMRPSDGTWGGTSESTGSTVNERVVQLAVGANPCVRMASGRVRCWGHNLYGSVGDGTWQNRSVPVELDLSDVTDIGSGGGHACAVLQDQTVQCWGSNSWGKLGDGTRKHRGSPTPVIGLTGVATVAPGPVHTCAMRTDGTVWCWGPALGLGDGSESPTVRPEPGPVPSIGGAVQLISGGNNFGASCALLADGTVRCWGDNAYGNLGDGSTEQRWVPVETRELSDVQSLSGMHPCATLAGGTVKCWGFNGYGQLGDGTTTQRLVPTTLTVVPEIESIGSGQSHKCAIVPGRTVRCWGANLEGQLGDGTQNDSPQPRVTLGLKDVVDVRGGWDTTCALTGDGAVWCWGWNEYGQLGDGSTTLRVAPVKAAGLGPLSEGSHTICVRATDAAGRTSTGSACSALTILDETPPTATVTRPAPIIGRASTWTVEFSEPVTGLSAADFSLSGTAAAGCSVAAPAGTGTTYQVPVTCTGEGTLTLTLGAGTVIDAAGLSGPTSPIGGAQATVDRTAPTATAPRSSLPAGTTIKVDSIPVDFAWSGHDAAAGMGHYQVRVRTDGGSWRTVATTKRTTFRMFLATGHEHQLSVRAVDRVGNVGAWANGPWSRLTARQESHRSIAYAGSWRTLSKTSFWGGSARSTTTAASRATMTFTGRSVAIVASRRPDSGWITIRIDGRLVAELDLHGDAVHPRSVVWTRTWKRSAEHTIVIRVLDSAERTRMDLDAIVTAS